MYGIDEKWQADLVDLKEYTASSQLCDLNQNPFGNGLSPWAPLFSLKMSLIPDMRPASVGTISTA